MTRPTTSCAPMPLFPSEDEIARAVLGERAKHWPDVVATLERKGFPQIEPLYGARFWPSCILWFQVEFGLDLAGDTGATMTGTPGAGRVRMGPFKPDSMEGSRGPQTTAIPLQLATADNRRPRPQTAAARRAR